MSARVILVMCVYNQLALTRACLDTRIVHDTPQARRTAVSLERHQAYIPQQSGTISTNVEGSQMWEKAGSP